jgi:hypothetical protein
MSLGCALLAISMTHFARADSFECKQGISKSTSIMGTTTVSIRDFALNEWCAGDSERECRKSIERKLSDPVSRKEMAEVSAQLGAGELAERIVSEGAGEVVDFLFSSETAELNVKNSSSTNLELRDFAKFIPADREELMVYGWDPSLRQEKMEKRAEAFKRSLGGGLTDDLRQILTFFQMGNFSIADVHEWYAGEFWGPEIRTAIVGEKLVVTLHSAKRNQVVRTLIYPVPTEHELEIPFEVRKRMRGLEVEVNSTFKIICRETAS